MQLSGQATRLALPSRKWQESNEGGGGRHKHIVISDEEEGQKQENKVAPPLLPNYNKVPARKVVPGGDSSSGSAGDTEESEEEVWERRGKKGWKGGKGDMGRKKRRVRAETPAKERAPPGVAKPAGRGRGAKPAGRGGGPQPRSDACKVLPDQLASAGAALPVLQGSGAGAVQPVPQDSGRAAPQPPAPAHAAPPAGADAAERLMQEVRDMVRQGKQASLGQTQLTRERLDILDDDTFVKLLDRLGEDLNANSFQTVRCICANYIWASVSPPPPL